MEHGLFICEMSRHLFSFDQNISHCEKSNTVHTKHNSRIIMMKMLTRNELADIFNVSTRTIDRLRAAGYDLGEFRAHPKALPRFNAEKVQEAIEANGFKKAKVKMKLQLQRVEI